MKLVKARDATQKEIIAGSVPIAAIIQETRADLTPPIHNVIVIKQSLSGDGWEGIGTSLSWNIRALYKSGGSHLTPRTEVALKFHS